MSDKVGLKVLKLLGGVKRMTEKHMARGLYKSDKQGRNDRAIPSTRWFKGVKMSNARSLNNIWLSGNRK